MDQAGPQPAGFTTCQHVGEHVVNEVTVQFAHRVGRAVANGERRLGRVRVGDDTVAFGCKALLRPWPVRGDPAPADGTEMAFGQRDDLFGPAGAHNGEHGVGGAVVSVVEVLAFLDGRLLQMSEVAIPVVGVLKGVERERGSGSGEPPVRPVEDVDQDFLLHHVDLVTEVLLGNNQRRHPVRL